MSVILTPHLVWLLQNQAVTVVHTAGLGSRGAFPDLASFASGFTGLVREQITLTSVIGFFPLVAAAVWGVVQCRRQPENPLMVLLLLAWAIPFGFYLSYFLFRDILAHWLLPSYLSLAVVAGLWAGASPERWRYRVATAFFCLSLVPLSGQAVDSGGNERGPLFAEQLRNTMDAHDADFVFSYGSSPRYMAWAEFFLPDQPFSLSFFRGELASQYCLWQDEWGDVRGQDAILIAPGPESYARERVAQLVDRGFFRSGKYIKTVTFKDEDGNIAWQGQVGLCLMRGYTGKQVPLPDAAPISTRFALACADSR